MFDVQFVDVLDVAGNVPELPVLYVEHGGSPIPLKGGCYSGAALIELHRAAVAWSDGDRLTVNRWVSEIDLLDDPPAENAPAWLKRHHQQLLEAARAQGNVPVQALPPPEPDPAFQEAEP